MSANGDNRVQTIDEVATCAFVYKSWAESLEYRKQKSE